MTNQNKTIFNLTLAGMCLAISIVMPTVFHFAGPQGGKMFLPLFWGVAMAALLLPAKYAVMVAVFAPVLSHLISAMPPIPMLYFMLVELFVYACMISVLKNKLPAPVVILTGLIVSRVSYIAIVSLAAMVFSLPPAFAGFTVLLGGVLISLPGIIAQAIIIPTILHIYRRYSRA